MLPTMADVFVVCPLCQTKNRVIDAYSPGAVLACSCGAHLEFVGPEASPIVVNQTGKVSVAAGSPYIQLRLEDGRAVRIAPRPGAEGSTAIDFAIVGGAYVGGGSASFDESLRRAIDGVEQRLGAKVISWEQK